MDILEAVSYSENIFLLLCFQNTVNSINICYHFFTICAFCSKTVKILWEVNYKQ